MKFGRYQGSNGEIRWLGLLDDGSTFDVAHVLSCESVHGHQFDEEADLVEQLSGAGFNEALAAALAHANEHRTGACSADFANDPWLDDPKSADLITKPGKLIGVGVNFPSHLAEARRAGEVLNDPVKPMLFTKVPTALVGHGEPVSCPPQGELFDYESEMAVVIGKKSKNISVEEARGVVAGVTVVNDLSLRDVMFHQPNGIFEGKNFDGFLPMSNYFVPIEDVPEFADLMIWSKVNGELRQNERMGNAFFSPEQIISYASSIMTLEPGDVIFCGTPEGVGVFSESPKDWLLSTGDVIEVGVADLVVLSNTVEE